MGDATEISWADRTHNEWIGCARVSRGCRFCYAEILDARWGHSSWGAKGVRRLTSEANRRKPYAWNRTAERARKPSRVFASSLGDVFEDHPQANAWRPGLFRTVEETPWLRWMLLTKRIDLVAAMTAEQWGTDWPTNVWLGTSVEGQAEADERLPILLATDGPAERFASAEPLLEPIVVAGHLNTGKYPLSLLIGGGESGPRARYNNLVEAARGLRDETAAADVPFLWKQWGEFADCSQLDTEAINWLMSKPRVNLLEPHEEPHRLGKLRAGHLLDGKTHDGVVRSWAAEMEECNV
jgi:protein gp37